MKYDLSKFVLAHRSYYSTALSEMKNGRKASHWMWYIFPQLKGLGKSSTSSYYGITYLEEAKDFLNDAYLGSNLLEISSALLEIECNDASKVMGKPDDLKLKSSMTLFALASSKESVFQQVLDKYFCGKMDHRTLKLLGMPFEGHKENSPKKHEERIIQIPDDNIQSIRNRYPGGLHFVVGDTHGESTTLRLLMDKIQFNPQIDHVYFLGDYNCGGNVYALLHDIAKYYQEDYAVPGFHLIRGNHERELYPIFELKNMPDIIVIRGTVMNYYLAHAGMVDKAFDLINKDIESTYKPVYAYALDETVAGYDAPLRQVVWSRNGLYSQRSHYHVWPSEKSLQAANACIIHGHTPFSQLKRGNFFSYGDRMLFWENQKVWFAEDLQSFDIDSNVKGRFDTSDLYRGLSCVCLEMIDEIAAKGNGVLKREVLRESENFVFSVPHTPIENTNVDTDFSNLLQAKPAMKRILLDNDGMLQLRDDHA